MRYFSIGINEFNVAFDLIALLIFSIVLIAIGAYSFSKA